MNERDQVSGDRNPVTSGLEEAYREVNVQDASGPSAHQDSIGATAHQDSIGATLRQDSIGATLRQDSIGATLRQAREALGLSVQDAASRLRLMNRQIEAMEEDDFALLGQPVFARGFVRNYARLLQLDPDRVLQKMGGARIEPGEVRIEPPVDLSRGWFGSTWLLLGAIVVLVLIAVPVLLYFWLNSGEVEPLAAAHKPAAIALQHAATRSPGVAQVGTAAGNPAPVNPVAVNPTPVNPAALDAAQADPTSPSLAPNASATTAATATTLVPPAPGSKAAAALPTRPDASAASPSPQTAAPAPLAAATPVTATMHFEFADDAWVEIRDGSGKVLHRQMDRAGSSADVSGQPPFNLVIGNAAQVRMTYNGRPLDIKPFIDITVARFTLEQ